MRKHLTQSYLSECFESDPDAGVLTWKMRPEHHFKSLGRKYMMDAVCAGKVAGEKIGANGYRYINYGGEIETVHRIMWVLHNGPIPDGYSIDHINGDRADNRLGNLRLATQSQQIANKRVRVYGASGVVGVERQRHSWRAEIKVQGKKMYLGTFRTKGLAAVAYAKESLKQYGTYSPFARKWMSRHLETNK